MLLFFTLKRLIFVAIAIGIILRFAHYLLDRSLWIDEAFLTLNIIERSYSELFLPLNYNQAAPIGFLLLEKLITNLFGNSEYALRLLPFISAIISLFLFYRVAKYLSPLPVVVVALSLLALSDRAGTQQDSFLDVEAAAYLYDLS